MKTNATQYCSHCGMSKLAMNEATRVLGVTWAKYDGACCHRTPMQQRYDEILRGRGMKVGGRVVCQYRIPTPHQRWIHPFWVGVIQDVSDEAPRDGSKSEAWYCANFLYVKVKYLPSYNTYPKPDGAMEGFTQRDSLANLLPVYDTVTHSPWFGSEPEESIRIFEFACRVGLGDQYREEAEAAQRTLEVA